MSDKMCQKCMRLNKQGNAVLWCIQCREECCDQCVIYHKAFKNCENHKFLDLAEYHLISPLLVDINETCTEHGKQIEYFCKGHDVACCQCCKERSHSLCNEKIVDLKTNAENYNTKIDKIVDLIELVDKNRSDNLEILENSQKQVADKLQKQKEYLQDVIHKIEEKQQLVDSQFDSRKEEIATFRQSLEQKRATLEERQTLTTILEKIISEDEYYVFSARKLAKLNESDYNDLIKDIEKLSNIQCKSDIRLSIGDDKIPHLTAEIEFNMSPYNMLPGLDNVELSSSTIEDDEILHQNKHEQTDIAIARHTNVYSNYIPEESRLEENNDKNVKFRRITAFKISKRPEQAGIKCTCASMLLSGEIILGEFANPRLMIYKKQTNKATGAIRKSELELLHGPKSLIVIDDTTVAYTARNYVGIVKIKSGILNFVQRIEINKLDDECFGLAFLNNKIIVNHEKSGLKILSLKGEVLGANLNVTGIISICAGRNDEIFFVQRGQRKVCSIFTSDASSMKNVCFTEQCPEMLGANGITTDESGLIYVSCDNSNKIYIGNRHTLLEPRNDISQEPLNIAYSKQYRELIVVNKDGKGITIYKKY